MMSKKGDGQNDCNRKKEMMLYNVISEMTTGFLLHTDAVTLIILMEWHPRTLRVWVLFHKWVRQAQDFTTLRRSEILWNKLLAEIQQTCLKEPWLQTDFLLLRTVCTHLLTAGSVPPLNCEIFENNNYHLIVKNKHPKPVKSRWSKNNVIWIFIINHSFFHWKLELLNPNKGFLVILGALCNLMNLL